MICLVWGTTWIAIKAGVTTVPPVFFAGTRFTIAGAILLAVAGRGRGLATLRPDLARLAVVSLLMITATYGLLFWGAQFISSGLAAILDLAFTPVALLGIGVMFGQERFTLLRALGLALGIAGLLVLFGPKALNGTEATLLWFAGGAAMVVSAFIYALGSVLARPLLNRHPAVLVSGLTTFGGGLLLTAGALAFEPGAVAALSGTWGWAAWAGWAFLVLFGSLLAYTAFLRLVRDWGPARAGSYAFVSPVIAVLLGVLVFGETVTVLDALGMAIMLAGAWLTVRPAPQTSSEYVVRSYCQRR